MRTLIECDISTLALVTRGMELTDTDRALILAGLFELTVTYREDDEKLGQCKVLVVKLGGDPEAILFAAFGHA